MLEELKTPNERKTYLYDYTGADPINFGATISSASAVAKNIDNEVVSGIVHAVTVDAGNKKVLLTLKAGVNKSDYLIVTTINFSNGDIHEEQLLLRVRELKE